MFTIHTIALPTPTSFHVHMHQTCLLALLIHHHALISFYYIKSQEGLFLSLYHGCNILANQIAA